MTIYFYRHDDDGNILFMVPPDQNSLPPPGWTMNVFPDEPTLPLRHEGGIEEIEAMNRELKREIRQSRWRQIKVWLRSQLFSGHGVRENRRRFK